MKKIAIFASGSGSNAENIFRYFQNKRGVEIQKVLTNNPKAGVIGRFHALGMDVKVFTRSMFQEESFLEMLDDMDLVVLAGFLWLVPAYLIKAFPNRIINIHPALLPNYGGKGMHGMHVHEAVIQNKEKETGITIHFVNEEYDKGEIIMQKRFDIIQGDTPQSIADKIHALEYEWLPKAIEMVLDEK
ncbi:MAG: phosphoribosylglycinamide formyltransferase [Bacteroidetes bacterium]|nr:phosphoribosylglycinamide formyltransferase [Bacteroidota bacterium]